MSDLRISSAVLEPSVPIPVSSSDSPAKIRDAAQQFEGLLLGQILESARQGEGWLGTGTDSSSDCAMSFADQQFATMMARQGGFGLATLIAQGLERK